MRLLVQLFLVVFAACAEAAPLVVRAGEHGDFTRVVIQNTSQGQYQVSASDKTIRVSLPNHTDGFDTSRLFDRIQRNRVLDTVSDEQNFEINLNCDCTFSDVPSAPELIVLDIRNSNDELSDTRGVSIGQDQLFWDESVSAISSFLPFDMRSAAEEISVEPPDEFDQENDMLDGSDFSGFPVLFEAPWEQTITAGRTGKYDNTETSGGPIYPNQNRQNLDNLAEQISRQLGLAASQGVLSVSPGFSTDAESEQIEGPSEPESLTFNNDGNNQLFFDSQSCEEGRLFDVKGWSEDGEFSRLIAQKRGAIFGEFDDINIDAVVDLARTYFFYGFFEEALQVLALSDDKKPAGRFLGSMAKVFNQENLDSEGVLASQYGCSEDQTLWAILGSAASFVDEKFSQDAVLAFNRLPSQIQLVVAARLSKRFQENGFSDLANQLDRTLNWTDQDLTSEVLLQQADLAIQAGNSSQAEEKLVEIVHLDEYEAPKALIKYIDKKSLLRERISTDTVSLVESYLSQARGTILYDDMNRAYSLSLVMASNYGAAIEVLGELDGTSEYFAATVSTVSDYLVKNADDIDFIRLGLKVLEKYRNSIETEVLTEMEERLDLLGFSTIGNLSPEGDENVLRPESESLAEPVNENRDIDASISAVETAAPFPDFGQSSNLEPATGEISDIVSLEETRELLDRASSLREGLFEALSE